ncbi:MAG: LEA type 2 family protein [Methanomassiliicoccus sp.]|nr:LEA type 2 family protein [Methanomassiliicoccus sp.]
MRWSLWAVRSAIIAVDLIIVAIIVLSILPLATGDLSVSIPDDQENEPIMEGDKITMSLPIDVTNYGYFSIDDLTLMLKLSNGDLVLTDQRSQPVDIPTGGTTRVNLALSMDLDSISDEALKDMVFNSTELLMKLGVEAGYSLSLVKATVNIEESMDWDPLISNYNVDTNNVQVVANGSNYDMSVPYTFSASELIQGRTLDIHSQLVNSTGVMSTAVNTVAIGQNNNGLITLAIPQEAAIWFMEHPEELRLLMDLDFEGATMHQEAAIVWAG